MGKLTIILEEERDWFQEIVDRWGLTVNVKHGEMTIAALQESSFDGSAELLLRWRRHTESARDEPRRLAFGVTGDKITDDPGIYQIF